MQPGPRSHNAMTSLAGMPVFFDVDGVLLDSLPKHLAICADKAREYGVQCADSGRADLPAADRVGCQGQPDVRFLRRGRISAKACGARG